MLKGGVSRCGFASLLKVNMGAAGSLGVSRG